MAADGLGQGIQQKHRLTHPVGQGRAIEFDAFASIDAGLAVQGCMVAELCHQNLGEQARAGPAAFDRQAGHRRLHDRLASAAAQLRADMADHLEAGGHVFQHLALVLADAAEHRAAAARAGAGCFVGDDLARQVWRQRFTDRLLAFPPLDGLLGVPPGVGIADGSARLGTGIRFEFADQQLKLLDRVVKLLGGAAEARAAQHRQLHLQLLDIQRLGMDLGRIGGDLDILACQLCLQINREVAQRDGVVRQWQGR